MTDPVKVTNYGNVTFATDGVATTTTDAMIGAARHNKIVYLKDTGTHSTGAGWSLGNTFSDVSGFKAGSKLRIYYMYPCRNDSVSWGGLYFEPQIRFNAGTWQSLGSQGFDGVMEQNHASLGYIENVMMVDPGQGSDYSVQIRYYFTLYDGTAVILNGSHDINNRLEGTPLISGDNGLQHYGHFIIEEFGDLY
jgi:hypothetical protein